MQHPQTRRFNDEWASFQNCILPCDGGTRRANIPEDIGMVPHRPPNDTLRGTHRQEFICIYCEISALRSLCPSPPIPPIAWRSGTGQVHQIRINLVRLLESGRGAPCGCPPQGRTPRGRGTPRGCPPQGRTPRGRGTPRGCPPQGRTPRGRGTPRGCPPQGKTPRGRGHPLWVPSPGPNAER